MAERKKIVIGCQGGGSHTAFTAGVLKKLLQAGVHERYNIIGLSGTSGGAICATTVWYGLLKWAKGSKEPPYKWLVDFWTKGNAANSLWEEMINDWTIQLINLQDKGIIPQVPANPYNTDWIVNLMTALSPRKEYFDFKALLEEFIPFQEINEIIEPNSPVLVLGACDILAGEFKDFNSRRGEITVDAILASAAIPNVFKAVQGTYWDGLFSQNPPVRELVADVLDQRPDELWIIQINPKTRNDTPKTAEEILDRRNELAGNLSLYQEVRFIELVNEWHRQGLFNEEIQQKYRPVKIRWIDMSPDLCQSLDYASKLSRSRSFIDMLIADGEKQAEQFLVKLKMDTPVPV